MKILQTITIIVSLTIIISTATAQHTTTPERHEDNTENQIANNPNFTTKGAATKAGAFGEVIQIQTTQKSTNNEIIKGFYRKAKPITSSLTGYMIQIKTSMECLDKNDPIFAEFGNIMVEKTLNPNYAYLIGTFKTKEGVQQHLDTVINNRYPDAKIVEYKKGIRQ